MRHADRLRTSDGIDPRRWPRRLGRWGAWSLRRRLQVPWDWGLETAAAACRIWLAPPSLRQARPAVLVAAVVTLSLTLTVIEYRRQAAAARSAPAAAPDGLPGRGPSEPSPADTATNS